MGGKTKGNRLWDFTVLAVVLLFLALGLLFIANLSGCGLIPQDRQAALKQEAIQGLGSKTTTDVVTTAKPEPLAPIKMRMTGKDGATVEVEQPVPVVTQTTAKTTAMIVRTFLDKLVFEKAHLTEDLSVIPSLEGSGYRIKSETGFSNPLTKELALTLRYMIDFDSEPADNKKKTDTRFIAGLDYSF